ncbi:hypothetical protein ABEV34_12630 [Methylorubrum rhodesianum]|jgi:hypothetical protein|uniref:Uncharacterized protein n=1 Tax=Methylorubrum rhodesianum TaxID=29427 RepID=A0ABU9ZAR0_9HYPH|nr:MULTISPECIES: hypothetical protein [Methylorubrum]MBB5765250.1 hypothetical protein [Methylorubrum rhodesianum]MBI1691275.1 hypothetical protein [Methylorubrum sp. DB1722]MBK3402845.1 hypothetical protein [Methylorubrum rhodesianum]MBY0144193.1 hypothetical protein [Methylorubrum populi]
MRPACLREVVERARADGDWNHHLQNFLDAFYRHDGDITVQSAMIAEDPGFLGEARPDAFLGGVGEHLARRWRLPAIPAWVRPEARYLDKAMFVPDERNLRNYLLCVSPVSFRPRLIFTGPDPLQRARFPYHRGVIRMPLTFPQGPAATALFDAKR